MPNLVNKMVVRDLTSAFQESSSALVVSLTGLTMEENETLRDSLAEGGVSLHMVRNKLARRALAECGIEMPADMFQGNVAIAFGEPEHAIHAAKVVKKSPVRKDGKVDFRGGLLDGQVLDAETAKELAEMPDRDTLRAQMLGVISGPARSLALIVNAVPSSVARVIQAHVDQDGEGEAA